MTYILQKHKSGATTTIFIPGSGPYGPPGPSGSGDGGHCPPEMPTLWQQAAKDQEHTATSSKTGAAAGVIDWSTAV